MVAETTGTSVLSRFFKMLYVVREKFPTTRVDLTELFSTNMVSQGHSIDWVMQSSEESNAKIETATDRERYIIGAAGAGAGVLGKVFNQCRGLIHDVKIWRAAKQGDYDFIQVRDKIFASLVAIVSAKAINKPFFYWMSYPYPENDLYRVEEFGHTMPMAHRWFYWFRGQFTAWLLYSVILKRAQHIFVQSERMREDVAAQGINPSKMTPVPMGVNLALLNPSNVQPINDSRLNGRLPIVYVGTLTIIRKMDFLVHVFQKVQSELPQAVLVMVGSAVEKDMQQLSDEVDRLGLGDHVIFTGELPMREAWGYIQCAKVCVSPFRPSPVLDSTSPTKIIEYLAWNRPVVANDHPDQSQVLLESGAGIVVPYKMEPFADAILELLKDEAKADRVAACGRAYVQKNRSYDAIARKVERIYTELVFGSSARK